MKKALLIIGIIMISLGVLALLIAAFFLWMHNSVLDGSNELYQRLTDRKNIAFVTGLILSVIGVICFVIRGIAK